MSKIKSLRSLMAGFTLRLIMIFLSIDDGIGAERVLERYSNQDGCTMDAREIKFANSLITCYNDKNLQKLNDESYNYSKITPFDPVNRKLIERLKNNISKSLEVNALEDNELL